jgi:tripartite-type tricarboxylate transporter receptor subunit TctC
MAAGVFAAAALAIGVQHASFAAEATPGDYYAGKTITLYVGFSPGGAAATEAVLISRYLPKYIKGSPNVIVGYKPGAGGRILNNYLYNAAPANGLEIGRVDNGVAIASLLDDSAIKFDARRFGWIGSFSADGWAFMLRNGADVHSLDELRAAKTKLKVGSISAVHKTYTNAQLIEKVFGVSFDMITGYPSGKAIELAIERGELDGTVAAYSGFMQRNYRQYKSGDISVLLQSGHGGHHASLPGLEKAPIVWAVAPPDMAPLLKVASLPWNAPFVAPPKTPANVVAILRSAFERLSQDAAFGAEYRKVVGSDVDFTPGERLESDVSEIAHTPPAMVEALRSLYAKK